MLKRTVRQAAETIGLIPSLADATTAAEMRRQALTDAQGAVEAARVALDSLHDAGAPVADISKAEAALADANINAGRAQLAYAAAERRLNAALEDDRAETRAAAKAACDKALAAFDRAAAEIDRLAAETAVHVRTVDAQYSAFNEARRDGVAGVYMPTSGATLAEFALKRAIAAQAGEWTDDKPTAADLAGRVSGAVMAVAA